MKRIGTATFFGLVAGGLCATATSAGHIMELSPLILGWILLNRIVMGFTIGISGLKLRWAWHGILIGLVVGSIFSYFLYMKVGGTLPFVSPIGNALFGLMIEFFTTVVFKQPAPGRAQAARSAVAA